MAFSGANNFAIHGSEFHNVSGNYTVNVGGAGTVQLDVYPPVLHNLIHHLGDPLDKVLQFLSVVNCEGKHRKVKSTIRAEASAGEWLLRHEAYTMWKEEKSSTRLLWLRGVRECGLQVYTTYPLCSSTLMDHYSRRGKNSPQVCCPLPIPDAPATR